MVFNFNIDDFLAKFDRNYDCLYNANRHGKEVAGQREAAAAFDYFLNSMEILCVSSLSIVEILSLAIEKRRRSCLPYMTFAKTRPPI